MTTLGHEYVRIVADCTSGSVLEVGARIVATQEDLALRPLFPGREYLGTDKQPGPGVDLVCDGGLVNMIFWGRQFSLGLCIDTLEHCRHPEQVIEAMSCLCDALCLRAPFCFPLHEHPQDYWRFTPRAFRDMLTPVFYLHGFAGRDTAGASWPGYPPEELAMNSYAFASQEETVVKAVAERFAGKPHFTITEEW